MSIPNRILYFLFTLCHDLSPQSRYKYTVKIIVIYALGVCFLSYVLSFHLKNYCFFLFVVVRFYTFGIGPEACPNLVQGVAGAGKGQAHFIAEDERMPVKVNSIFREDAGTGMLQGTETYPWDML